MLTPPRGPSMRRRPSGVVAGRPSRPPEVSTITSLPLEAFTVIEPLYECTVTFRGRVEFCAGTTTRCVESCAGAIEQRASAMPARANVVFMVVSSKCLGVKPDTAVQRAEGELRPAPARAPRNRPVRPVDPPAIARTAATFFRNHRQIKIRIHSAVEALEMHVGIGRVVKIHVDAAVQRV